MLFENLKIKNITLKNRVVVSPMCQYSAVDGYCQDHHRVHYGQLAMGGAGLVFLEATAVKAEGRITNGCLGIWDDNFLKGLSQVARIIQTCGSVPAIQLAHAGQKGSMQRPWHGNGPQTPIDAERGDVIWTPVAPSNRPLDEGWLTPRKIEDSDFNEIKTAFILSAERALKAGFKVVEIHMAHGYLLHSFLSPISNLRTDQYGGSIENRMRYPIEIVKSVRKKIGDDVPLFVRISSEDGFEGGWTLEDSIVFCKELKKLDVDVIDCSSGGNSSKGATVSGKKKTIRISSAFCSQN
jgi:2,4-dienoyl-CoA reductase-like NADH-dependent reductase (Old Yellow Enzyme family)